jgi:L-glutamine-phosphate cytidylyltransferase
MSDTAIILAAGRGIRLRPRTDLAPKALLPVAGRPIIAHIFAALQTAGVRRFFLVTGYKAEDFSGIKPPSGCCLQTVVNDRWHETNSMYSLSLCVNELRGGGYIVEGDCCFNHDLLAAAPKNADGATSIWFARPFVDADDGCCLHAESTGRITSLTIGARGAAPTHGWKSCGVVRVSKDLGAKLPGWLSSARDSGRERDYYDLILGDYLAESPIHVADIGSAPWYEVDNEADLQRAEEIFGHGRGTA